MHESDVINTTFVGTREACRRLGVHANTLRSWYKRNHIKGFTTSTGRFRYDLASVSRTSRTTEASTPRQKQQPRQRICYCRVSSRQQKEDLERQVAYMRERYPDHQIIKDIGSGLNFKRSGLQKMVGRIMLGDIEELVVAHRDRLARFGVELIETICKQNATRLLVLSESGLSPEQELTKDLLSILHVFSCRMYGLRKYSKAIRKNIETAGGETPSSL